MGENKVDWKALNHVLPEGYEKYLLMLCEAGSADNELKLLTRFQKVIRLIHDEKVEKENASLKSKLEKAKEQLKISANQLEGVSIAIETHGQNINTQFFIKTYKEFADEKLKALEVLE